MSAPKLRLVYKRSLLPYGVSSTRELWTWLLMQEILGKSVIIEIASLIKVTCVSKPKDVYYGVASSKSFEWSRSTTKVSGKSSRSRPWE